MGADAEHINASGDTGEEISKQSDNIDNLSEISRNSRTTFIAILLAVAYSYITIGATTDASLFSNSASSPLPIIQAQVPIVWFYYFAPLILFLLFIYFHVYLQRFWRCVAALPLRHKDGRTLDEYIYPWIISAAFLRAEIPDLNSNNRFRLPLEAAISIVLAWWLIPIILVFFWARYLTLHHWPGTIEHIIIIVLSVAGAIRFYFAAKNAVNAKRQSKRSVHFLLHPNALTAYGGFICLITLLYLSFGAIEGAPMEECKSDDRPQCGLLYSGGRVLQLSGYSPSANLKGNEFLKPENWWELVNDEKFKERLNELPRPNFAKKDLRFADARNAFLLRASFQNAKMEGVKLDNAILINADFKQATIHEGSLNEVDLRWADLADAKLPEADLWYADLQNSHLSRVDFSNGDLLKANLKQASGVGINFTYTNLRSSDLISVQFTSAVMKHTNLQKVDLTGANILSSDFECVKLNGATMVETALTDSTFTNTDFENANLSNAFLDDVVFLNVDFQRTIMTSAFARNSSFTNAKFNESNVSGADFIGAEFVNTDFSDTSFDNADLAEANFENSVFRDADFGKADVQNTVFKDSDLSGANLLYTRGFELAKLQGSCGDSRTLLPSGHVLPACKKKIEIDVVVECVNHEK